MTKRLIHKVISQSCVAFNPWTAVTKPKTIAIKLCSLLGRELTGSREVFDFLRTVEVKPLQEAQEKLLWSKDLDVFLFGPGIDSKSDNPFFPVDPWNVASEGIHLPYLVGYSAREGLILLKDTSSEHTMQELDRNYELFFGYNAEQVLERYNLSATQVKQLYYKGEKVSCEKLDSFVDLMSDIHFVEGIHRFARVQADRSSALTYMYVFDFDSPDLVSKKVLKDVPRGVSMMDDAPYVLRMKFLGLAGIERFKKGSDSYEVMEQMTEIWANFAKYGRHTIGISKLIPVNWLPIADGTLLRYLSVDEDLLMKSTLNVDQKFLSAKSLKL